MAINTITRQTSTVARVHNDHLNDWTDWAGTDINVDVAYQFVLTSIEEYEQAHWAYRGQAAMCVRLSNDTLIRVRIGDGSASDHNVYRQIITDPEDPDQWEAWALLYSGAHYAIAIEQDGTGYRVFTAKSDGVYVDNVFKLAIENVVRIKPIYGVTGRLYLQTVEQDSDGFRAFRWYYTYIWGGWLVEDAASYRWYRHDLVAAEGSEGLFYRFRSMAHEGGARDRYASEVLTSEWAYEPTAFQQPDEDYFNQWNNLRYHKGPSAQAGYKTINNLYLTSLPSSRWPGGAYFLFFNERHFDTNGNVLSNLKNPLFWCRSVGYPYYMSEPVPVGYSIWGFAGAVAWRGYIWAAGNGRVLRRPQMETTTELSDYVLDTTYEVPRDNQKGSGTITLANPNNVIGAQLGLTDDEEAGYTERRIDVAIGQKGPTDDDYTWKVDDAWRIAYLRKTRSGEDSLSGKAQRLIVSIGNFWHRLENRFRDTILIPGRFTWNDWQPDEANQLYNYSNDWDEFFSSSPSDVDEQYVPHLVTTVSNDDGVPAGVDTVTLFAGWRGENGWVRALIWEDGGLVFRYQDARNFYLVTATSNGTLALKLYQDGAVSTLASTPMTTSTPFWLTVDFRWSRIRIDVDLGDLTLDHTLSDPVILSGFVGTTSREISNLAIQDWNTSMTTKELLRILLAYVDEHEVVFELDEETAAAEQFDMLLGPQSDLDTPEKAFRQVLDASNLQVVFLED